MANKLQIKRGLVAGIPTGSAGEPLFTTDTNDLYIGTGSSNIRFQKYIASGATTQILLGDGSLYNFPLAISSPSNGQYLTFNGTSWVNTTLSGTGITTLNTLTATTQTFATGTSGTDFNISSATSTHTFNLPTASGTNRGALSSADWTNFTAAYNDKINSAAVTGTTTKTLTLTQQDGGTITASWTDIDTSGITSLNGLTAATQTFANDTNVTISSATSTHTIGWTGQLAVGRGGTGASTLTGVLLGNGTSAFTAITGTASQYLRRNSGNTAYEFGAIGGGDVTGAALTKTDDTNVTLTLGGTPTTALLRAASLTLGWSGQLSIARGGTGLSALGTANQLIRVNAGATALEYFTPSYLTAAITSLNGLTAATQTFAVGTSGTDFNISSTTSTHTFNLPTASSSVRGALSSADWTTFNNKQNAITLTTTGSSGAATFISNTLNIPNYTLSGLGGVPTTRTLTINGTAFDLSADRSWSVGTVTSVGLSSATSGVTIGSTPVTTSGTITLAIATASGSQQGLLSSTDWTTFNNKQNALTNPVTGTGTINYIPKFTATGSTIENSNLQTDASGNLGLGVTPSAWQDAKAIQVGSTAAPYLALFQQTTSTSDGYLGWNARLTGYRTFAYITTGDAVSLYRLNAGNHVWFNAPSGTAGNAITFTQAMTLDASGYLHLGLENLNNASVNQYLRINAGTYNANSYAHLDLFNWSNNFGNALGWRITSGTDSVGVTVGRFLSFSTVVSDGSGNPSTATERARLTSNGRLLLGTATESTYLLDVAGNSRSDYHVFRSNQSTPTADAFIFRPADNTIALGTANTTRLTINSTGAATFSSSVTATNFYATGASNFATSGGNVGIGTSSPSAKLDVRTALSATSGIQNIADFYAETSGSTTSTYGGRITIHTKNPNGNYWPAAIAAVNDAGGSNLSSIAFYTATAGPTLNERARIDSNGQLKLNSYQSTTSFSGTVVGYLAFDASGNILTASGSGGGGTPAGSNGQVQFNSSGSFGADSNFFWDNTNKRLGIGTASPGQRLTVEGADGSYLFTTQTSATNKPRFQVYVDDSNGVYLVSGYETTAKPMRFTVGGSDRVIISTTGSMGVGSMNTNRTGYDVNGRTLTLYGPQRSALELGSETPVNGTQLGAINFLSSTTVKSQILSDLDGSGNANLTFVLGASNRAIIKSTGQLQFNNYQATTSFSGTVVGYLAFDASGNILTTAAPGGSGTVTSIATTGPITGGTITTSGTIGITQSTTSTDGYLSSTDWNTFNGKQGAITLTTTGTSGSATLVGTTLNIPVYETLPVGSIGYVQFVGNDGFDSDSNFFWDNTNKRLGLGTTSPSYRLDVTGQMRSTLGITETRIDPRSITTTSTSTLTPDVSADDVFILTGQTATLTLANPTGTPVNGQKIIVRIFNTTGQTINYGTQYRASSDFPLPTTTTSNRTIYLGFIYNSTDTKWDLIAKLDNFA